MSAEAEKDNSSENMATEKDEDPLAPNKTEQPQEDSGKGVNSSTEEKADEEDTSKNEVKKESTPIDGKKSDEEEVTEEKDKKEVKSQEKTPNKANNGTTAEKKKTQKSNEKREGMAFGEIYKINENLTNTKVEGLQTLHTICFNAPGKPTVVKKSLRKFCGFNFADDSEEYKEKLVEIGKNDVKQLKATCEILELDNDGTKDEICERLLEFLIAPEGNTEPDEEAEEEEEEDPEEAIEEPVSEEETKRKRKRSGHVERASKNTTGRPRRATAGRSNRDVTTYVDYSSSEESGHKFYQTSKRKRRRDDSDSGSDYNPSGGGSDSDAGRRRSGRSGGGRGRAPARRSWRKNSESEEESPPTSEEDSDEPKKKKSSAKPRGRVPPARGRKAKKKNETETEEESELESEESEDDSKKKLKAPVKNNKPDSKPKAAAPAKGKQVSKVSTNKTKKDDAEGDHDDKEQEDDDKAGGESEDEPLSKKSKPSFPTDDEIKSYVKEILDEANLEEITMKTVCKQVYAKYPEFDLTDKKDFIKATVKSLIAT